MGTDEVEALTPNRTAKGLAWNASNNTLYLLGSRGGLSSYDATTGTESDLLDNSNFGTPAERATIHNGFFVALDSWSLAIDLDTLELTPINTGDVTSDPVIIDNTAYYFDLSALAALDLPQ